MGKLGMKITPGEWKAAQPRAADITRPREFRMHLQALAAAEPPSRSTGSVERAFTWLSYYTLVFTAFCIFMPAQTVSAAAQVNAVTAPVVQPVLKPIVRLVGNAPAILRDAPDVWSLRR